MISRWFSVWNPSSTRLLCIFNGLLIGYKHHGTKTNADNRAIISEKISTLNWLKELIGRAAEMCQEFHYRLNNSPGLIGPSQCSLLTLNETQWNMKFQCRCAGIRNFRRRRGNLSRVSPQCELIHVIDFSLRWVLSLQFRWLITQSPIKFMQLIPVDVGCHFMRFIAVSWFQRHCNVLGFECEPRWPMQCTW